MKSFKKKSTVEKRPWRSFACGTLFDGIVLSGPGESATIIELVKLFKKAEHRKGRKIDGIH